MMRGFAIVVSALVALAAQAQQTEGAEIAVGTATVPQESAERPVMLASRTVPAALSGNARKTAPGGAGDAGTKPGEVAATEPAGPDCSIVETFLGGLTPAIRKYQSPLPDSREQMTEERPPYVAAVAHCGQLYIFQIKSSAKDAWVVQGARLESPKGELLQVNALRFSALQDDWSVNVIVAEARPRMKVSRLKLHLTGQDGRVAQLEARDLP